VLNELVDKYVEFGTAQFQIPDILKVAKPPGGCGILNGKITGGRFTQRPPDAIETNHPQITGWTDIYYVLKTVLQCAASGMKLAT
jgi:hypothetical protein